MSAKEIERRDVIKRCIKEKLGNYILKYAIIQQNH